jgi:hypothetical protein
MHRFGYDPSVIPDPVSYESALLKSVPKTLAREVFHAIKLTQNRLHRPSAADQCVVKIEATRFLVPNVRDVCEWIEKNAQENADVVIEMEFTDAHRFYGFMLICLLTYRARWPGIVLPVVWIIDSNLPPLPANYPKAFVWRYQTHRTGSMSGKLLEFGISNLKSLYAEHANI